MRSSSQLFPVALTSAEILKDLAEDVYVLKHDRGADKTVRVALTRIHLKESRPTRAPIVLMHGFFFNRSLWINGEAEGLAAYFARQGYDVWIPELRGHGLSPANQSYSATTSEDYWRDDIPAVNEFVIEQTGHIPFWIGQGWGGLLIAAALGMGTLPQDQVQAVALIGIRISYTKRFSRVPGVHLVARWRLKRHGALEGEHYEGPEVEPFNLIQERMKWTGRGGLWYRNPKGTLWAGLAQLRVPLHVLMPVKSSRSAMQDAQLLYQQWGAEDKQWSSVDLQNVEAEGLVESSYMIAGEEAERGVWPQLQGWMHRLEIPVAEKAERIQGGEEHGGK